MTTFAFKGLHHVLLAMPAGSEDTARTFYGGLLAMTELDKPSVLAVKGGCWFRGGQWEVHLGVAADFRPARKAHPGVLVDDLTALVARLAEGGVPVDWDDNFPGFRRCYANDPFGNRIEFLEPQPA